MLLRCCYTPAHAVLYREIFCPSIPGGFELVATELPIGGTGDFLSEEFLACIRAKIRLVIDSIASNAGRVVVWSDVDVRFFDLSPQDLSLLLNLGPTDILFQRECARLADVNTGFFVMQCSPTTMDFFQSVQEALGQLPGDNEQMVVNRLLQSTASMSLQWGYLPMRFYARTHGWPPPRNLAIYHANYTKGSDGVGQKLRQFREIEQIQTFGLPARLWSLIRRLPSRILRER